MTPNRRLLTGFVLVSLALASCGEADLGGVGSPVGDTVAVSTTSPSENAVTNPDNTATPSFEEEGVVDARDDLVTKPSDSSGARSPQPAQGTPVEQAMADLAIRLDRPMSDISLVLAEEVTWRDGSLGCPQPGKFYTQALVPGLRIRLAAGDEIYEYHSGGAASPFLCADPQEPVPGDA